MSFVALWARVALFAIFVWAGLTKLVDGRDFEATIASVVPSASPRLPGIAARLVVVAELACAAMLSNDRLAVVGMTLSIALLGLFTIFIARMLARSIAYPCNCFGSRATGTVSKNHLWRNSMMIGIAVIGMVAATVAPPMPILTMAGLVAGMAAIPFVAVVVRFNDLTEVLRR